MVVRMDQGCRVWADCWGKLGAEEVVQEEVQEEVMAAPAAREVDDVKEPAMAGRPGRGLEEPVPGVDAVVGATVAQERGGMKDLRIGLEEMP